MIKSCSFGKININDKIYTKDLILYKDGVHKNWWREKGHFLQLKDVEGILNSNPDIIIIGRGFFGMMKISKEVIDEFKKRGLEYYFEKSAKAIKLYNKLSVNNPNKIIIAAFHLTC